ncbi:MAG: aminopeptidase P N-terminal domain-containing protein [Nitrospinaceae bacterium]
MKQAKKKRYSGIFRDGGAGAHSKKRFRERRKKLMAKENRLLALAGVPHGPGQETLWAYAHCPTYQEPAVMYLTGVNQAEVILLLDPGSKESDEILFVKRKDPGKEFWDGLRFGVGDGQSEAEARGVTGIKDVRDIALFNEVFCQRLKRRRKKEAGVFWLEGKRQGRDKNITTDHNWNFKKRVEGLLRRCQVPQTRLHNIMRSHFELRLPLDRYDVANVLKAQRITREAFERTLGHFHQFRNECAVQGFLEGRMLMHSPYGLSFPSIIASGSNATVLHYMKNDDAFRTGEMVLLDFGVRWMTMHADISRTVPASGRFNPLQRLLYEIVLGAQAAVQRKAAPGVIIQELNEVCWNHINEHLDKRFHALGGKSFLSYEGRPHGVSHLMGEQEHDGDPFRNYGNEPMQPGWMISNEPGLYGRFKLRLKGKLYDEELGIRIEDNLLITEKGCRNLSAGIPKKVETLESLMNVAGQSQSS